jgi:tripartite ATP-independent transporter DctP family solute receptor
MFHRSPLTRAAGLVLGAALAMQPLAAASAADVTIRFGWATTDSETDAYNYAAHAFADALEAAKPGHFKVSYFPNHQLGDERDMLQGLQLGTVNAAMITNSIVANIDEAFVVNDLPFLYASAGQAYKVLDGPLGDELFARLRKKKVVGLSWCESGFRNMVNRTRPITKPEDLNGLKFRVIESPLFVQMFSLLGSAGVPMPYGSVFTALQQGTIDGMENPTWAIASAKMNEVTKYFSITRHIYSVTPVMMSGRLFDSLSPEDQKTVVEAGKTACIKQRKFSADLEAKIIKDLAAQGMAVNEIADPAAFQARMKPLYDEYRPKIGAELMDRWLAALKQ